MTDAAERNARRVRVLMLHESGMSARDIAESVGCNVQSVRLDLNPALAERNRQRANAWRALPGNAERQATAKAAYREANLQLVRAQKRATAVRYNEANRQAIRDKANAKRERQRAAVIEAYGERCNCPGCHVAHGALLTLDHVEAFHHRRSNRIRRSTRDIYRKVIEEDFPPEYQLLCGSCNLAKTDKDRCPLAGEDH